MNKKSKLFLSVFVLVMLNGCGSDGNSCKEKCTQQNEHSLKYCKKQVQELTQDFKRTQQETDKSIRMQCVEPHQQALEACQMACN